MSKIIVANLKMNYDLGEMLLYKKELDKIITNNDNLIVAPQYPYFSFFNKGNYSLCSQDISEYISGSYTGEVSARDIASLDVEYCLINHSERKIINIQSKETILTKINNLFDYNIIPILCLGEYEKDYKKKKTLKIIEKDLINIFSNINSKDSSKIIVAYEPIWSIGTEVAPSIEYIVTVIKFIKDYIKKHYNININVIYGGSVNEFNIDELSKIDCDGYLLGKSCLEINKLETIITKSRASLIS